MPTGIVISFFYDRGFGFIRPDDGGENVFVHRAVNGDDRSAYLSKGDAVSYDGWWDKRKGKYVCSSCTGFKSGARGNSVQQSSGGDESGSSNVGLMALSEPPPQGDGLAGEPDFHKRGYLLLRLVMPSQVEGSDGGMVELGNLDRDLPAEAGDVPRDDQRVWEVLCDGKSLLKNPFRLSKSHPEEFADCHIDAFQEYLDEVLDTKIETKNNVVRIASHHRVIAGNNHWPNLVRGAFYDLCRLAQENSGQDGLPIRLMCRCTPRRCHTQCIADRVRTDCGSAGSATSGNASARSPDCDGVDIKSRPANALRNKKSRWRPTATAPRNDALVSPTGVDTDACGSTARERREARSNRPGWGAAGIIAFRFQLRDAIPSWHVCLVKKRNGMVGFPKGRAENGDETPFGTAVREWREETNLPEDNLDFLNLGDAIVESWTSRSGAVLRCQYFVAHWQDEGHFSEEEWQIADDPEDLDPVVSACWTSVADALTYDGLSRGRKDILLKAFPLVPPSFTT